MRKHIAALLCLVTFAFIFANFATAQQPANNSAVTPQQLNEDAINLMRQDIRSARKQVIAANLPLTDVEATKFWPTYDRYIAATTKLNDSRYALIQEYAKNYETMTDAQAETYIKQWLASDADMTKLRLQWIPEFEKVVSPKKTAMFMQMDRRLGLMIEIQIAGGIPLVKP